MIKGGTGGWKGLNGRFKRRFLDRSFDNGFGLLAAFATLGGNTKLTAHVSERTGATSDGFPDLAVGYCFAEAYVHGGGLDSQEWLSFMGNLTVMRISVNW